MRRLWITRHKAKAAGKAIMNVYMEDPENGDTEINECLCRKLGELKNDQQKRFNIGNEAAKVFVVADARNRNLYNDFAEIPEGEEDVFLSGKNYQNPRAGNPFRFDGAEEEELPENRETGRHKGKILLIIAIVVGIVVGVLAGIGVSSAMLEGADETIPAKTFACQGLQITLTEEFTEISVPGYTTCYSAGDTAVFLMREDFAAKEGFGELDLDGYGAMILANNHLEQDVTLEKENGLTTFAWVITDEETGVPYYYHCGLYKGPDAFWMVQITTEAEGAAEEIPQFRQWLKSVVLAG